MDLKSAAEKLIKMIFNQPSKMLLLALVLCAGTAIAQKPDPNPPAFIQDFPMYRGFNLEDSVQIDLAKFVKNTFQVDAIVDPKVQGQIDVTITDVFAPEQRDLEFEMFGVDCKYTVESKPNYAYVMLCGQSGLNVAWIGYDKNNLDVQPENQKIQNILMLPQLSNESITKCKNVQIGQGEIDKFTIYVACYGKSPDATSFESPDDMLYIIALSPIMGKNSIGYRGHTSARMTDVTIGDITGEIDILLNYDKSQNEDIVTVISKDDNALLPAFQAFTARFNTVEKSWIGDGAFITSQNKDNFVNYPISDDNKGDLYDVFEDDENIYLVIKNPNPTPGSVLGQAPSMSFDVASCGIPKKNDKKIYLECTDRIGFFSVQSASYPTILFNSVSGGQLSSNGSGNDIIVFHNQALMGFSFTTKKVDNKPVLSSEVAFMAENELFKQLIRPTFAHIVDKKVYVGGIVMSTDQVPKEILAMAVYYAENNALSRLYSPPGSVASDVIFVRNNLYTSEAHDIFRIRTSDGKFFAKHLNVWKAIISNLDPKEDLQTDVSITFQLAGTADKKKFDFTYTNVAKGIQAILIDSDRQTTVYTDVVNQLGSYGSDFIGNNINVSASSIKVKTDSGEATAEVTVKYTDSIDDLEIKNSKLTDVTGAFYLGDLEYVFKDSENGIQVYSCFDFVGKSTQRKDSCFSSFEILQKDYAPSPASADRRYELLEAQRTDDYYVFLLRDTDQQGMPDDGHGIVVFYGTNQDPSSMVLQKISRPFVDCTMRIKDDNLEIFLAQAGQEGLNNGSIWSSITSLKNPETLSFIRIQDKFNSPQQCPVQVELMPDTDNLFVVSDCPSDDELRARKVFQYKITKAQSDPQGLRVDNLSSLLNVKSFELSTFNSPQLCVTRNRIHVFETSSSEQANAQNPLVVTLTVDEGVMVRYYIPLSEVQGDDSFKKIDSFHCNFDTSIVSATSQVQKGDKRFDTVIVIDTNKLDEPSSRIHSIRSYEVQANAERIKGVVGGSVFKSDEVLLLFYQERSPNLKAQSIFMSGPHFFVDFSDVKVGDKSAQVLEQTATVTLNISETKKHDFKLNIMNPITTGLPTAIKQLEFSSLTKDTAKVVLSDYVNFANSPILNLSYQNKHDEAKLPITSIVSEGSQDFTFLTDSDFEFVQFMDDYALVYKNDFNAGKSSSVISLYKKGSTTAFYTYKGFVEISTAQVFRVKTDTQNQLFIGTLNREDDDYIVSFITINEETKTGDVRKTKNIENSDLQDGIIKAHFKHQQGTYQKGNIVVSMIAYSNTYVPKVIVMNFIFDNLFQDPSFWGSSFVTFQDDIIDFEVSYASDNDILEQPKGVKTGGYIALITERSSNIDIVALAFDDDEQTKENEGGLRVQGDYDSAFFTNQQNKGEKVPYKEANLTCSRYLTAIAIGANRKYNMKCAVISHSVYSPEIELLLDSASDIKKGSMFAKATNNKNLINMPGFLPAAVERQDDIIVVIWRQNTAVRKVSDKTYLKEKYLAAFYDLNQGNNNVAIYTPNDLGADPNANPLQVLIYVSFVQSDIAGVSKHNIYISAPAADSKLTGAKNRTLFSNSRVSDDPK